MNSLGKSPALLLVFFLSAPLTAAPSPQKSATTDPRKTQQRADPLAPLLRQAGDAIEKNDYTAAVPLLVSYLAQRPEDAAAHFQLGYVYSGIEHWEDAKTEYGKAIALNPKMAAAHLNLGLVLLEREPATAVEPLRQAAELLPDQARPRYLLGMANERSGKMAAAIEAYKAARQLDGKNPDIRFALGRALLESEKPAEAEEELRAALASKPDAIWTRHALVVALIKQGKLAEAVPELEAVLAQPPESHHQEIWLQLAFVLRDLKRYDDALVALDRAEQAKAGSSTSAKLRAEIYAGQKHYSEAIRILEGLFEGDFEDGESRALLGRLYLEQRNFPAAERELKKALTLEPQMLEPLRDLMAVYYLSEQYRAALDALDFLAKREVPNAGSWFVRATCYDKLERKAEAVAAYEKFLALDQGHSENHEFQARQRIRLLTRELQQKKR